MEMLKLTEARLRREAKREKYAEQQCLNAELMNRPCMVYQPVVVRDGDGWKAVKGDVEGKGSTPAAAMDDFDNVFTNGWGT